MSFDALRALASKLKIAEEEVMHYARELRRRVVGGPSEPVAPEPTTPERIE